MKAHFNGESRPAQFPGIAVAQPMIGIFDLPAVLDFLVEDAVLIADAVAG